MAYYLKLNIIIKAKIYIGTYFVDNETYQLSILYFTSPLYYLLHNHLRLSHWICINQFRY